MTTWETTFSAITSQTREASQILTFLAFLHFDDIFMDLFDQPVKDGKLEHQDTGKHNITWQSMMSSEESFGIYIIEAAFRTLQSYSLVQ